MSALNSFASKPKNATFIDIGLSQFSNNPESLNYRD